MAEQLQLHSTIEIDGTPYEVVAKTAEKVKVPLTIKVVNGDTKEYKFDGSSDPVVEIKAVEEAGKLTHDLTIKEIGKEDSTFNGSENATIDLTPYAKSNEVNSAIKDLSDNVSTILTDYATESHVATEIAKATEDLNADVETILNDYATKKYVDDVKNDLLNGAGDAYDTLKELGVLIDENKDAIEALTELASESANTIKVHTDFGEGSYKATITISSQDPKASEGTAGNIWFKY